MNIKVINTDNFSPNDVKRYKLLFSPMEERIDDIVKHYRKKIKDGNFDSEDEFLEDEVWAEEFFNFLENTFLDWINGKISDKNFRDSFNSISDEPGRLILFVFLDLFKPLHPGRGSDKLRDIDKIIIAKEDENIKLEDKIDNVLSGKKSGSGLYYGK